MTRYFIISVINGILFGILDGLINANPFARKLFEAYKPIAKTSLNLPAGIIIDIVYGFILGFFFLVLYQALPGETGAMKGVFFALIIWFCRVLMNAVSTWMMLKIPTSALVYTVLAGLVEMLILGLVYGLFLRPFKI